MVSCCQHTTKHTSCVRKTDGKVFKLPRKFSKERCMQGIKGFTMKASCAPYKACAFNVYVNKNPRNTISIKYTSLNDVKNTIKKLERLYKQGKYPHNRIWQVGMILMVRLRALKTKKPQHYKLAQRYLRFLGTRTKSKNRKSLIFKI